MSYESFAEAQSALLWGAFIIAVVMGALVNKTNFCTMGAVSDMVNMGDWGRMRAWILAIAVAMLGVSVLEASGLVRPDEAFPPYRGGTLIWFENLIGGLIFGIGMTLASGCGNKTLVRIGGGNIKSIMVLAIIGVIAYYMTNILHENTDQTLMTLLFGYTNEEGAKALWIREIAISLTGTQDLGALLGGEAVESARLWLGVVIALALLGFVFKSADFRHSLDNILGGLGVGLAVLAFWYLSSNVMLDLDGDVYTLGGYYGEWAFLAESDEGKPAVGAVLNPQSYTFINPMGQLFGYTKEGFAAGLLSAGLMGLFGIIVGSLLWSLVSRSFRIEWFTGVKDFLNHFIGAILMGFGGVLALGCTIGQGITGTSTLALGSVITLIAIIYGSALTMKVQLYKMVYEDEASFGKALITGMVDLKLLPASMRKLDAV